MPSKRPVGISLADLPHYDYAATNTGISMMSQRYSSLLNDDLASYSFSAMLARQVKEKEARRNLLQKEVLLPGLYTFNQSYMGYRRDSPVFKVNVEFTLERGNWGDVIVFAGTLTQPVSSEEYYNRTLVQKVLEWKSLSLTCYYSHHKTDSLGEML